MKKVFLLCKLVFACLLTLVACSEDDDSFAVRETSNEYRAWKEEMVQSIRGEYEALQNLIKTKTDSVVAVSLEMANQRIQDYTNTKWTKYDVVLDGIYYAIQKTTYKYNPYSLEEKEKEIVWRIPAEITREIPTLPSWELYYEEAYKQYSAINPPPQN